MSAEHPPWIASGPSTDPPDRWVLGPEGITPSNAHVFVIGETRAQHVLRAINCHDELLDALKGVAPYQRPGGAPCWCEHGPRGARDEHQTDCLAALDAIKKAEPAKGAPQ